MAVGVLALGTGAAWASPGSSTPACHGHHGHHGSGGGGGGGGDHGGGGGSGGGGGDHGGGGGAPPGNNGTIKIDQSVLSPTGKPDHANHPHVSCQFALSFFGYDTGTDTAQVSFTAQPPSGKFTPVPATVGPSQLQFTVPQRTGGGQLDVSVPYQLDVSGLTPKAQGYHIRVTVDVSGAKNADGKTKVFWYQPCAPVNQSGGGPAPGSGSGSGTGSGPGTGSGSGSPAGAGSGGTHGSAPGSASLTSAGGAGGAHGSSAPVTASTGGAVPTGAATDLGPFAPPMPSGTGVEWWEVMAGLSLAGAASGTVLVGRARRRARA